MTAKQPTIYFVHGRLERWSDLLASDAVPDLDSLADRLKEGRDTWIISAYVMLKRRGLPVALASSFVPNEICVAHYDDVSADALPFMSYVVAVRADRDRTYFCEAEIVQNPVAATRSSEHYIIHWTQPGLIPRDASRGNRIENLVYYGRLRNLAYRFRDASFSEKLKALGIALKIRDESEGWRDYSDTDVVLAVRDGTPEFLAGKPANKLVNAWQAGCPALVGPESAYRALQLSSLDYVEVSTPEEVISALVQLKENPELYSEMVSHGSQRAQRFTHEALADEWERLLFETLRPDYERWSRGPRPLKLASRATKFLVRRIRKKAHGARYVRGYDEYGNKIDGERKHRA